ncbi:MAG: OmpA family protein [Succinivibrio sp.]|nr:OmpA family protein [Succinivibrio sp.]
MSVLKFKLLLGMMWLLPCLAMGQVRYSAPIDSSANKLWSNTDSKLACTLIHDIPRFGYAEFKTYGGRVLKSSMQLVPKLGINDKSEIRFISTKPEWQSGGREVLLGRVPIYTGFNPYVGATLAWKILSALSHGQQILMPYTDEKLAAGQNIIPSLSPLGFDKPFQSYMTCQEHLLRVNFADVQMLPLAFQFQSEELTNKSRQRLQSQLDYIKEDKSITVVTIRAYAYDMKTKNENIVMADKRAETLRKLYVAAGIADGQINVVKFNALTLPRDRDVMTPNYNVTARNALVSLERDNAMVDKDLDAQVPDVGATLK